MASHGLSSTISPGYGARVHTDLPPLPSTLAGALGRPLWTELRAPGEAAALARTTVPLADGGGRRVVLVTGYMAGPATARVLRRWLERANYEVTIAGVGRNAASSSAATDKIFESLRAGSGPSILIGHSRGGQQSRVAAARHPELVSQLITLGSPVRHHLPRSLPLRASVEAIRLAAKLPFGPEDDPERDAQYESDLFSPFPTEVPWASIYSKLDGVVEWQACLDPGATPVEVDTSHGGLLASISSYRAIAGVLAERVAAT